MTRFLPDTNIVSETIKPRPSAALLAWLGKQRNDSLYIAALSLAELRRGMLRLPVGKKRNALQDWFEGADGPPRLFAGRVLPFDAGAASHWALLMAEGDHVGRPRSPLDMVIAATALTHDCRIVTANEKDFAGLDVLNPLEGSVR